jgi:hypothetical protein
MVGARCGVPRLRNAVLESTPAEIPHFFPVKANIVNR